MRRDALPRQQTDDTDAEKPESGSKRNPVTGPPVEPATRIDPNQPRNHHQPAQPDHRHSGGNDPVLLSTVPFATLMQPLS